MMAVEMPADEDPESGAGTTSRLLGQVQSDARGGDDIVATDNPFVFPAEDLIEVDAAERHERRGGIRRWARKLGVARRKEAPTEGAIRGGNAGDSRDAQFVPEAALERAIGALTAAAGLGGIAKPVFDTETRHRPADLGRLPAVGGPAGRRRMHGPVRALGVSAIGKP